jgi:hypothetical protein
VAVGRIVAAADVSTFEADPQVEPRTAGSQALSTAVDGFGKTSDLEVVPVAAQIHAYLWW